MGWQRSAHAAGYWQATGMPGRLLRRQHRQNVQQLAYGSAAMLTLPPLPAPSCRLRSYGVAINRNQTDGELEQRLVWALNG